MAALDYRPALDGVRALAVLAVIAYHLELPLAGGFLGVDVFFVLSGYLITTLLLRERERRGSISLTGFWARRARRLLPAMLLVVMACAVAAARGPVLDLQPRREDMIATLAYYANWHFISTDQSYFAQYVGASPLRHMWSLAIEEQFYVLWPLVCVLVLKLRSGSRWLIATILAGSALSAWRMATAFDVANPSRAYFGTDTRVHELLVGAGLAVLLARRAAFFERARVQTVLKLTAPVAASLVLIAVVVMGEATPDFFRGGSLVLSLSVAVWLLALEVRPAGSFARVLGLPPLVLIGRISYGLYLWHWPFVVWLEAPESNARRAAAVMLTFAAASASYVLVERPVREGRTPWMGLAPQRLAIASAAAFAVVLTGAVASTASPAKGLAAQVDDFSVTGCPSPGPTWCFRTSPRPGRPTIAVVGDSTSLALDPGMRQVAAERGWGYVQAGRNGCSWLPLPVGGPGEAGAAQAARCAAGAESLLDDVATQADPDLWIVQDSFLRGVLHTSHDEVAPTDPRHRNAVLQELERVVTRLAQGGAQVALLETPPPGAPAECAWGEGGDTCEEPPFTVDYAPAQRLNATLRQVAGTDPSRILFVSTGDLFCRLDGVCPASLDGVLLVRYDGTHLTAGYSRLIVPELVRRTEMAGARLSSP